MYVYTYYVYYILYPTSTRYMLYTISYILYTIYYILYGYILYTIPNIEAEEHLWDRSVCPHHTIVEIAYTISSTNHLQSHD